MCSTRANSCAARWIDAEGVPEGAPRARSARLDAIAELGGALPSVEAAAGWSPTEWQLYLESVPRPASAEHCRALDERFALTRSTNYEILVSWLSLALLSGYDAVLPRVTQVLSEVGRMKFLRPLYTALAVNPQTRALAVETFARLAPSYHPISRQVVDRVLRETATPA